MNVLFISHESGPMSGSALSLYDMVLSLQRKGVNCYVIMPIKCHAYTYFCNHGIKCYVIRFKLNIISGDKKLQYYIKFVPRFIYDGLYNICAINRISRIFKDKNIDIVHSNTGVFDIGPKVAQKLGAKHVWHLREFQDLDFNFMPFTGWKSLLKKIHKSDGVIAITKPIYNHFNCEKCNYAVNMFDAVVDDAKNRSFHVTKKEKNILFCGFICPAKRLDVALKIFSIFYLTHTDYKFIVVGKFSSDEYKHEIIRCVENLNISHVVDFVGYTETPDTYYNKSQVLIMSSASEAQGRVTIEAMLHGCIVIGYNSGGTALILKEGFNGFLFNNENEGVSKLSYVCDNYEKMQDLIKNAFNYSIKEFSISSYGNKLLSIYNKILDI